MNLLRKLFRRRKAVPEPLEASSESRLIVPEALVHATHTLLASFGGGTHEGVVYWAGHTFGNTWVALEAIAPEAETGRGFFNTSSIANAKAISEACNHGLSLIAQVHSHPGGWVDHSDGDDRGAFKPFPGTYSIVVPSYARSQSEPGQWGVYRWDGHRFSHIATDALQKVLLIIPTSKDLRNELGLVTPRRTKRERRGRM